jgi:hypothetical protein
LATRGWALGAAGRVGGLGAGGLRVSERGFEREAGRLMPGATRAARSATTPAVARKVFGAGWSIVLACFGFRGAALDRHRWVFLGFAGLLLLCFAPLGEAGLPWASLGTAGLRLAPHGFRGYVLALLLSNDRRCFGAKRRRWGGRVAARWDWGDGRWDG